MVPRILASLVLMSSMVTLSPRPIRALSPKPLSAPSRQSSQLGWQIATLALSYQGYRYAYTGDTPATGFSCTGFVAFVYRQYGYVLPEDIRVLAVRYPSVMPQNLMPGDILIFSNTVWAGYSHAAIYLGGGRMIGADNFAVGVAVSSIYEPYWYSRWTRSERVLSV